MRACGDAVYTGSTPVAEDLHKVIPGNFWMIIPSFHLKNSDEIRSKHGDESSITHEEFEPRYIISMQVREDTGVNKDSHSLGLGKRIEIDR